MLLSQPTSSTPDPTQSGGGETFLQRMQRLQGQSASQAAGVPQQGQSTSPYSSYGSYGGSYSSYTQRSQPQQSQPIYGMGTQPGQATTATPVQGDGKIPPPSATPAPASAPANSGFAAGWTDFGNGLAKNTATGQVLPTNNPVYQQLLAQGGGAPAASQPYGSFLPARPDSTNLGPYSLDPGAAAAYQAQGISQYQAPNQNALNRGQSNLVSSILANPESMDPQTVAAMQESNKEQAVLAAKQAAMGINAGAAARGLSGGGSEMGDLARLNDQTIQNVLSGNRDIATQAAQTNFQNKLQASSAVDQALNAALGRSAQAYTTGLTGQQAAAQQNLQNYNVQRQNQQDLLNKQMSQFGINQAVAGNQQQNYGTDASNYFNQQNLGLANKNLDLQTQLGLGGLGLSRQQLANQASQFQQNYGLNVLQFLENQRQANNNLGYNYSALNANDQNQMINHILGIG